MGPPQGAQAHAHGEGQQKAHPKGGLTDLLGLPPVPPGQSGRDGGDDAGGEGDHHGEGQVIDGHGFGVDAVKAAGGVQSGPGAIGGQSQTVHAVEDGGELAHDQFGVYQGDDGGGGRA